MLSNHYRSFVRPTRNYAPVHSFASQNCERENKRKEMPVSKLSMPLYYTIVYIVVVGI